MRKMLNLEISLLAALAAIALLFFLVPTRPQMWFYPLVRQAAQVKTLYETRNMAVYETAHFKIKYGPQDADDVAMVARTAEDAYKPVTDAMGYAPGGKTLIVIYPSRQDLNKAFGWSGDQSAMGVYWGGVIQILSPHAWLKDGDASEFTHAGPMVHEFTHLVFDMMANGNYPRWFTEGLAQYVEYKVNDYEWRTPNNSLSGNLYTMAELDGNFDDLGNQALAYRESLAAVRYIAEVHGEAKLHQVIVALSSGKTMEQAITGSLGMSYAEYEAAWRQWAVGHMEN